MGRLMQRGNSNGLRGLGPRRARLLSRLVAALTALFLVANAAFAGTSFACCTMTGVRSLHACCPAPAPESAPLYAAKLASSACCSARVGERLLSGQAMSAPVVPAASLVAEVPFLSHRELFFEAHGGRAGSGSDPPTAAEARLRIMVFLT
jgi:hypothetical protein